MTWTLLKLVISSILVANTQAKPRKAKILIVLDGFRSDYGRDESFKKPNLDEYGQVGSYVADVEPVFPSSRYPNIASMLTGVYSDTHDVLDNEVYSKDDEAKLYSGDAEFWRTTRELRTIWDIYRNASASNRVKILGFPDWKAMLGLPTDDTGESSEQSTEATTSTESAVMNPTKPTRTRAARDTHDQDEEKPASPSEDAEQSPAANDTKSWYDELMHDLKTSFKLASDKEDYFYTIFVDEPGKTAREMGPDHVADAVKEVDDFIGKVHWFLEDVEMADNTDLLIVSTPGYMDVTLTKMISLKDYVHKDFRMIIAGHSPVINIKAMSDLLDMYSSLVKGQGKGYTIYAPNDIPKEWHYKGSRMVQDMVLIANPGYVFGDFKSTAQSYREARSRPDDLSAVYGVNGYNISVPKLHTSIFARGPSFREMATNEPPANATRSVSAVDVFPLLCHMLEINAECLNMAAGVARKGDLEYFYSILQNPPNGGIKETLTKIKKYMTSPEHIPITLSVLVATAVICLAILCIACAKRRHKKMLREAGFRYSQVRNNRRTDGDDDDWEDDGDKRGLLSENSANPVTTDETEA